MAGGDGKENGNGSADPVEPTPDAAAPEAEAPEAETDASADDDNGNGDLVTAVSQGPSALRSMMSQYFLEYASYVIKDRAIPNLGDGLKPVQRRIFHSLWEMDDGKFHKVANVVGTTMKYHPHGDASIYNALVHVANKEYLIEKQGNFGNIFTGDVASAARYIECRLSPLAREAMFNPRITEYIDSYDGRNREPIVLPAKLPVLLMQGAEGIAVGMATRILPHNFNELLKAQVKILRQKRFRLYPDFFQGGALDAREYDDGNGRVRLRATIQEVDPKTLVIREIPATTTTESLISSIEDAVSKGKLKVAAINDYTAETVEIEITLPRGVNAKQVLKPLYAYTDCEVQISVNCLVIEDNRPVVSTVSQMLEKNTWRLKDMLGAELELELARLEQQVHSRTLAQIFIENRIYKRIEECDSEDAVYAEVRKGLKPFLKQLKREVTDDDIGDLLRIPIRRISLFDINRNRKEIGDLLARIKQVKHDLAHLTDFAIKYLEDLRKKYGKLYPRHTRIEEIEQVDVRQIALSNVRVGLDRSSGYVGSEVKSDNPIVCTEFDRLVILKWDGTYKVVPVPDKLYVGPVCEVFKADKSLVYSMIYRVRKTKLSYAKRFRISKYIMDREYRTTPPGCKVEKIFDRQGVVARCEFQPKKFQRQSFCELNFDDIAIRSAAARGKRIAPKPLAKVLQVKRGSEGGPEPEERPPEPVADEYEVEPVEAPSAPSGKPATLPTMTQQMAAAVEKAEKRQKRARRGSEKKAPAAAAPTPAEPPPKAKKAPPAKAKKAVPAQKAPAAKAKKPRPTKKGEAPAKKSDAGKRAKGKGPFLIDEDDSFQLE